jgi:ATP-dependent Clp protease, protease subunit
MEIQVKEIMRARERLNEILAFHTGQTIDRIKTDTDRDNFMSGADGVAYGLIDKVLDKRTEAPELRSK